jgi:hypothetical protein
MRRFAAVALREISERRFVLVAAAAAAVLPFLVPFLPGVPADQASTARSIVALTLSCAFGLGGSLLVGASVVGRELAEKRLSFHFSRPLPAPVVWAGKLAGGLVLVLVSELVVLLPTSAASGGFPGLPGLNLDTPVLWAVLLLAVPFFLLAWVGSVALRSRSPWLVVDLVLLVTVPALPFLVARRLIRFGHDPEPSWLLVPLGVLLAALLGATLAQVAAGRTDARRGHGAQSLVLWGLLLTGLGAGALQAERTIDPGVARLVRAWATPAGAEGRLVFVEGSAAPDGRGGTLYVRDLAAGTERVLPMSWQTAASADGSRIAIVHGNPFSSPRAELEAIDTARGDAVVLGLPDWPEGVALSSDGGRLAIVAAGVCQVLELPSLRLLASARVPSEGRWAYAPLFVSADRVRLHPLRMGYRTAAEATRSPHEITDPAAAEIDVPTKSVSMLGRYPIAAIPFRSVKPAQGLPAEPYFQLHASPDRSRVLVVAFGAARSVRLLDASTGSLLASFDGPEGDANPAAFFLADGRIVVADWLPGGRRLVVLSPQGERLSEVALPVPAGRIRLGYEPSPGVLAVGIEDAGRTEEWSWSLVDLATGSSRPLAVDPLHREWWSGATSVPAPGSPATRLALEKGTRRLVLYDPATGATTPLTRGRLAGK